MDITTEKLLRERLTGDAGEQLTVIQNVADFLARYLNAATPPTNPGRSFFDESATAFRIMAPMMPRYRQLFVQAATVLDRFVPIATQTGAESPLPGASETVSPGELVLLEDSLRDLLRAALGGPQ